MNTKTRSGRSQPMTAEVGWSKPDPSKGLLLSSDDYLWLSTDEGVQSHLISAMRDSEDSERLLSDGPTLADLPRLLNPILALTSPVFSDEDEATSPTT